MRLGRWLRGEGGTGGDIIVEVEFLFLRKRRRGGRGGGRGRRGRRRSGSVCDGWRERRWVSEDGGRRRGGGSVEL